MSIRDITLPLPVYYQIYLSDPAQVATLQAAHPQGIQIPPSAAAATYGAPIGNLFDPNPKVWIPEDQFFGLEVNLAFGAGVNKYFTVPFTPYHNTETFNIAFDMWGAFEGGISWERIRYIFNAAWIGIFMYQGPPVTVAPPPDPTVSRYWVQGFETGAVADRVAVSAGDEKFYSRDASRTVDGLGFAYRANNATTEGHLYPGTPPHSGWTRMYIRARTFPSAESPFWAFKGSLEGFPACTFSLNASGTVIIRNVGNGGFPGTQIGTFGISLGTWVRLDIFHRFKIAGANDNAHAGGVHVYVNGTEVAPPFLVVSGFGLGTDQTHISQTMGFQGPATNGIEIDIDDWIAMASFTLDNFFPGNSADWNNGSHVQLISPIAFGPAQNGWVGDWRTALCHPGPATTAGMTSVTGSATIDLITDFSKWNLQVGCIAMAVGSFNIIAAGATYQMGRKVGAGAAVLRNVVAANLSWNGTLFVEPSPSPLGVINFQLIRDAGVVSETIGSFLGQAELLGTWGVEDTTLASGTLSLPPKPGIHNSPYPYDYSTDVTAIGASAGAYSIQSGIYSGNNLGQDVVALIPAHWWYIRQVGVSVSGTRLYTSEVGSHTQINAGMQPDRTPQLVLVGAGATARIAGNSTGANASGSTYQWVAVGDPSSRFMRNGAWAHRSTLASAVNPIIDPGFTPIGTFVTLEQVPGGTSGTYYKGPGHPADQATLLDGATSAGLFSVGAGSITSLTPVNFDQPQVAYSAWKITDMDGDATKGKVGILSYVGDGTASRNIAVNLGGRSPLLALGVPHNNNPSFWRDPSFTTTHSITMAGADSTTGFIGGDINIVVVGVALNAVGVTYDLWVLPGFAVPGGWSPNDPPVGPPGVPPIIDPPPLPPVAPPLPPPGPTEPPGPPIPPTGPPDGNCPPCILMSVALATLASRLQDVGMVHWTNAELTRYMVEAQRTWNALTNEFQAQVTFNSILGVPFYDLPTTVPAMRAYTITDTYMVADMEYALMEPPTPTAWTGTAQFTFADIVSALQQRRDQFLLESGMVVTRVVQTYAGPPVNGRITLNPAILTLRRIAYIDDVGAVFPLQRDDEWGGGYFSRLWPATTGVPFQTFPIAYSMGSTPPHVLQVIPPAANAGVLDMLAVTRAPVMGTVGPCLDPTIGIFLGVPDDWTWVVKFGALATLLNQQGVTYDPQRAAYCEARFRHGVLMASQASTVLAARINGVAVGITSVNEADQYNRLWQRFVGNPTSVLLAGQALVGLSPVPVDASFTVTLDLVRNCPVAVAGTDCVATDPDTLEALISYAMHLAIFKEGPAQLQQSMDLLDRFFRAGGIANTIQAVMSPNRQPVLDQTKSDEREQPRILVPPPLQINPLGGGGTQGGGTQGQTGGPQ